MNQPSPAIVSQKSVTPLARWVLLLLCLAYILPGYWGRSPWRSADMAAFGYMRELALGHSAWWQPTLAGLAPDDRALLPYWLGAWSIQMLGGWLAPEWAARLPFALLLGVALWATWSAIGQLALCPAAQPVAFAFGGEATPADYARAMADAGLLALIACLGLAQMGHENTSSVVQLAGCAGLFAAIAYLPRQLSGASLGAAASLLLLLLSGAPSLALLLGLGGCALLWLNPAHAPHQRQPASAVLLLLMLAAAGLAWGLDLWRWRIVALDEVKTWDSLLRLLVWFCWPAWPLALWTLWRWRQQWLSRQWPLHLLLPLWFGLVTLCATLSTYPADRALLLALPALAALAAFALPTFSRGLAALLDWFSLLFFSICTIGVWVIWLAVQTGIPAKPAANVAKLAPGYSADLNLAALALAIFASLAWCLLVHWRVARQRSAIWKSLVLPAAGASLTWILIMTLWLPLLDYGRSYMPQLAALQSQRSAISGCVLGVGLDRGELAALGYYHRLDMQTAPTQPCDWAVIDVSSDAPSALTWPPGHWQARLTLARPTSRSDRLLLLQRQAPNGP